MNMALLYLRRRLWSKNFRAGMRNMRKPSHLATVAVFGAAAAGLAAWSRSFTGSFSNPTIGFLAVIMLLGSLVKGFSNRDSVHGAADRHFLDQGPFSPSEKIGYSLTPQYIFAALQTLVLIGLFRSHFHYPALFAASFFCFQLCCFHLRRIMSLWARQLAPETFEQAKIVLLTVSGVTVFLGLKSLLGTGPVEGFLPGPWRYLFYPAFSATLLAQQPLSIAGVHLFFTTVEPFFGMLVLLGLFLFAACLTYRGLETCQGRYGRWPSDQEERAAMPQPKLSGRPLDPGPLFLGAGALLWRNWLLTKRNWRPLFLSAGFTLIYTLPIIIMLRYASGNVSAPVDSDSGVKELLFAGAILIGLLPYLLQRSLPFDFRVETGSYELIRLLPASSIRIVLLQLTIPCLLCLLFQLPGIVGLFWTMTRIPNSQTLAPALWLIVLGAYPAVMLGINAVWNFQYLGSVRHVTSLPSADSAWTSLAFVAASGAILAPAVWTAQAAFSGHFSPVAIVGLFVLVQTILDLLLLAWLARRLQNLWLDQT